MAMSGWRAAGAAWAGDALGGVARQRRDAGNTALARRPAEMRPWSCMGSVVVLRCVQGVTRRDSGRARRQEGKYCELQRLGARSEPMHDGQSSAGRRLSCQRNSWVGMKLVCGRSKSQLRSAHFVRTTACRRTADLDDACAPVTRDALHTCGVPRTVPGPSAACL